MKIFEVDITRSEVAGTTVRVKAANKMDAFYQAMDLAGDLVYKAYASEYEVSDVREINEPDNIQGKGETE